MRLCGRPELVGVYANFRAFPSDHVALFTVRQWEREAAPPPNREIAEQTFFPPDDLPETAIGAVRRRLSELLDGAPRADWW